MTLNQMGQEATLCHDYLIIVISACIKQINCCLCLNFPRLSVTTVKMLAFGSSSSILRHAPDSSVAPFTLSICFHRFQHWCWSCQCLLLSQFMFCISPCFLQMLWALSLLVIPVNIVAMTSYRSSPQLPQQLSATAFLSPFSWFGPCLNFPVLFVFTISYQNAQSLCSVVCDLKGSCRSKYNETKGHVPLKAWRISMFSSVTFLTGTTQC